MGEILNKRKDIGRKKEYCLKIARGAQFATEEEVYAANILCKGSQLQITLNNLACSQMLDKMNESCSVVLLLNVYSIGLRLVLTFKCQHT